MKKDKIKKEEAVEVVEEVKEEAVVASGEVSVFDKSGAFIRTYSSEAHGKDYKKLAEGFAKKIGGIIK